MIFRAMFGLLLMALVPAPALCDAVDEARNPVDRLNQALIESMKGGQKLGL